VPVRSIVVLVYGLSGLCAAIVGILLTGFNTQAFNGMGDPYLLSSIAVVVVGGTLITGGKGHYLGVFGAALLLTALQILLTGSQVGLPVRDIIYGIVLMIAIFAHREKQNE
jgi:ribose transport system permease protein